MKDITGRSYNHISPRYRAGLARLAAQLKLKAGDPSRYIDSFQLEDGQKVVIVARVSNTEADRDGLLLGQTVMLPKLVREQGGIVVPVNGGETVEYVGPGYGQGLNPSWTRRLWRASKLAKENGAVLLAACTDRLIKRSEDSIDEFELSPYQATEDDLAWLSDITSPCRLMTYLPPDAGPEESQSLLSRWARQARQHQST